jgi:hypothetical protein
LQKRIRSWKLISSRWNILLAATDLSVAFGESDDPLCFGRLEAFVALASAALVAGVSVGMQMNRADFGVPSANDPVSANFLFAVKRSWQIQRARVVSRNGERSERATRLCWTGESHGGRADNLAGVRRSFVASISHAGLLGYLRCGCFNVDMAIDLFS